MWALTGGPFSEIWFGGDPLLGPWASSDGTIFLATDPDRLDGIFHRYKGPRREVYAPGPDESRVHGLEPIDDLARWLDERHRTWPYPVTFVINPLGPRAWSAVIRPHSRRLITTTGEFELGEGNVLRPADTPTGWSGFSTLLYSGGPDLQMLPLGQSFCHNVWGELGTEMEGRTTEEATEFLTHVLEEHHPSVVDSVAAEDIADVFGVVFWEQEYGDRLFFAFPNLVHALAFLAAQERHVDRARRTTGLSANEGWQIDVGGSQDEAGEDYRGERIQRALVQWGAQFVTRPYVPADGDILTRVVNATFRSIHVEAAGFLGDLFWRMNPDPDRLKTEELDTDELDSLTELDLFRVLNSFPCDAGDVAQWLRDAPLRPDPRWAKEAERRLGHDLWHCLDPRSQFFLATALGDFAARGDNPNSDYAPVNLSLIKALEVELGRILARFRSSRTDWPDTGDSRNDQVLARYLENTESPAPTIGEIRHLFGPPAGPLQHALRDFLVSNGHRAVTTSRFREKLAKVINVYRNGGVHDKPITLDICRACIEDLLDGKGRPGLVAVAAFGGDASCVGTRSSPLCR